MLLFLNNYQSVAILINWSDFCSNKVTHNSSQKITLNPGSNELIDKTPPKGRPKETTKKNKGFKGTLKELKMDVQNVQLVVKENQINRNIPLHMENNYKVCFFSFVVQALFS